MRVTFDATLTKVTTKRAKHDKDGVMTEEPASAVTVDVPVSAIPAGSLGALLRAMDREITVELFDGQTSFDMVDRDGARALEPVR